MNKDFFKANINPYISRCEEDTFKYARNLAKYLEAGDVIALSGDLGAGKTTFTKAIAEALKVKENVSSPTFTIVKEYRSGIIPLFHFDLYRLSYEDEFYDIGGEDYLFGDGITIIEWANLIEDILTRETLFIDIDYGSSLGERIFKLRDMRNMRSL